MNRRQIRDPRRIARRFRFTFANSLVLNQGITTWPMLKRTAKAKKLGEKQMYNRAIHSAAITQ